MGLPKTFKLNDGNEIPALGYGTVMREQGVMEHATEHALRSGYTHIDAAPIYRDEPEVGRGIKNSGVNRKDFFLTSKLWNNHHRPDLVEPALDKTLKDLGTDYLDLYLMHWPPAFRPNENLEKLVIYPENEDGTLALDDTPVEDTWAAMVKLLKTGKVKSIGVSNFNVRLLKDLLSKTDVVPAANQIEFHPYLQQPELLSFCKDKGILVQGYGLHGTKKQEEFDFINNNKVKHIANQLGVDPALVCYSWGIQKGVNVLAASGNDGRIANNLKVFELPQNAVDELDAMDKGARYNGWGEWGVDVFDELGEAKVREMALQAGKEGKWKTMNP